MDWLPIAICYLSIPLSLFMWTGNIAISKLYTENEEFLVITPVRWLISTLLPLILMHTALRRKSVSKSGAGLGVIFAFILSIASHAFFVTLAAFFFSSSRATKYRADLKKRFEADFREGEGQRNWVQVLCNAGMATQLAILYLIDCGSSERPIDFGADYRASWLGVGIMSSFACCNGDTWASELGSVLHPDDPYLITTQKRVPRGTNGGISNAGLLCSLLGGMFVGAAYFVTIYFTVNSGLHDLSPSQWPLIGWGALAGLFGSLVDSLLGATLQYSGITPEGKIVERPGPNVRHICGLSILDNHSVNLISSIVTGVTIPALALVYWPSR